MKPKYFKELLSPATLAGSPLTVKLQVSGEAPGSPKLLDWVRIAIRTRHYSRRTEEAYVQWVKRFIFFTKSAIRAKWDQRRYNTS